MKTIDIIVYFSQVGGFSLVVLIIIRGLRLEIINLKKVIEGQNSIINTQTETLIAMEKRVEESEKFKDLYRKFISDLPEDIDNYKRILSVLKDEAIKELELANKKKDEKLTELSKHKIQDVINQEKILDELPKLRDNLINTHNSLEKKLSALEMFQPGTFLYNLFKELEKKAKEKSRDEDDVKPKSLNPNNI